MIKKLDHQNFETVVNIKNQLIVLKFGSQTCGPCKTIAPVLEKLASENPKVPVYEIDTDESPELASHFGIRSVPTIHFCENREILYTFNGVTPYNKMQYVINNINDKHFRETGEFRVSEEKKDNTFLFIVIGIIALFLAAFLLV